MFKQFHDWLENRRVKKMGFTTAQWESAIADWPVMRRYQGSERDSLRELTFRFLVRKSIVSGGDFQFSDAMCLKIATMACVPILHLGLDWYDHWYTVILYEGDFVPNRPYRSEDGVVHPRGPGLSGEAWLRGPVILSWESVLKTDAHTRHGKAGNVVIHELAHKLDCCAMVPTARLPCTRICRRSIGYSASSTANSQYHWRWQACKPQRF